jgi:catechol 2,3-dioxygenase-like lactoylglutathione lyase family enzyme
MNTVDLRLEVVVVPVSAVDRAKAFYTDQVGFKADLDERFGESFRVVQLTPPGSACSIVIGTGLTPMEPGSLKGIQLVVDDMDAAYELLSSRGVDLGDIVTLGAEGRPGFRHVFFEDPDGNAWTIQEIRR